MKNNIRYVAGFASALFLAACSGGASEGAEDFQAPAPPAQPSASATTPAAPLVAPAPAPTTPTAPSMPANPTIAQHCNVSSATTSVCIENAQGHAGDTVDVPVFLIGDATCGMANEADGHIQLDLQHLSLANDEELVGCRTHHVAPDVSGTRNVIQWNAFGDHVVSGCADIPIGKVDTMKIQIAPGTPAGDYALSWEDSDFVGPVLGPSQCSSSANGINGTLRVLP